MSPPSGSTPWPGSVWERVLELRTQEDMTVLLTTHYMEEAEQLCDRVGLLLDGRLRAVGRPRELLLGLPGNLAADFAALALATAVGIAAASLLLGRLAR